MLQLSIADASSAEWAREIARILRAGKKRTILVRSIWGCLRSFVAVARSAEDERSQMVK